jgi:hypothetical protein
MANQDFLGDERQKWKNEKNHSCPATTPTSPHVVTKERGYHDTFNDIAGVGVELLEGVSCTTTMQLCLPHKITHTSRLLFFNIIIYLLK